MMKNQSRREFLKTSAGLTAAMCAPGSLSAFSLDGSDNWDSGDVHHLLPTVNHNRILLKVSFKKRLHSSPRLRLNNQSHVGTRTDMNGEFWSFDVGELKPEEEYKLGLVSNQGHRLCDPWKIKTFPDLNTPKEHFRLLVYTCAGGHDAMVNPNNVEEPLWVSIDNRRKMFKAGLSYKPDAAIAIGDHVYWDLRAGRTAAVLGNSPIAHGIAGKFDRSIPVLGTDNERKLHLAVRPQIADLYGTLFRSTPCFFLQDDHDYFENDEAMEDIVTFPPDDFMFRMARATQAMYYPEFLPDPNRPMGLPGSGAQGHASSLAESFGTLRFGDLLEIMLYDCRRGITLKGGSAEYIPATVESWLLNRMAKQEVAHVVNVPSNPIGWSAGKWGEWYPDIREENGQLGLSRKKYMWQEGWQKQHDRLLDAAHRMNGLPLFLSGDIHALAAGKIMRNGKKDLSRNPIISVLTGPISTGPLGWPSSIRGIVPDIPVQLDMESDLPLAERNGFSIIDFSPSAVNIQFFSWKMGETESGLDNMKPYKHVQYERQG